MYEAVSATAREVGLTDKLVLVQKLAMLREHSARVRTRRPDDLAVFEANTLLQDAIALNLVVAAQEAGDVALHIAADEGWGVPGSYREGFELLATNGVITTEHAAELAGVIAVRNRIAHGYASLDPARMWAQLPAGLDALDRFVAAIAAFADPA